MALQQQKFFEGQDLPDPDLELGGTYSGFIPWAKTDYNIGCANSEHGVPCLDGYYSRRKDFPPDSRHSQSGLHASDESQLDHVSHCTRIRTKIPSGIFVGAILQLRGIRHRDIHQHPHQKEATSGIEEEGRRSTRLYEFIQ